MGLKDIHGKLLGDKWREMTYSYLGMTCKRMKSIPCDYLTNTLTLAPFTY